MGTYQHDSCVSMTTEVIDVEDSNFSALTTAHRFDLA
jgi:hypothetical protein